MQTSRKMTLSRDERRVAALRARGLSYRKIEEKFGKDANGTWAYRVARRIGVA